MRCPHFGVTRNGYQLPAAEVDCAALVVSNARQRQRLKRPERTAGLFTSLARRVEIES